MLSRWKGEGGYKQKMGEVGEARLIFTVTMKLCVSLCTYALLLPKRYQMEEVISQFKSKTPPVPGSIFHVLSGSSPLRLAQPLFQYSYAERRVQLGSRQFHYTESSCFSSGSRPLCWLPSTQNWKHGTNNIMCYSNFTPGLVICPSAVTSVADRADVPASLPVFPRHLSLKLSRLHNRSAIETLTENFGY